MELFLWCKLLHRFLGFLHCNNDICGNVTYRIQLHDNIVSGHAADVWPRLCLDPKCHIVVGEAWCQVLPIDEGNCRIIQVDITDFAYEVGCSFLAMSGFVALPDVALYQFDRFVSEFCFDFVPFERLL